MKALTKAIFDKAGRSTFSGLIGGRLYEDFAPPRTDYPYVVFSVISSPKEKTFTEVFRNTLVQFSLFSSSTSSTEIKDIYEALSELYDECSIPNIANKNLLRMYETNFIASAEEHTTATGDVTVRFYAVDYEILTEEL